MPPIGQSTSIIGAGAIGAPAMLGSPIGSLFQTPAGVPGAQSSMSGGPLVNPALSPSGSGTSATGFATGVGSVSGVSGAGSIGAASGLTCFPEDFICGGVVVKP